MDELKKVNNPHDLYFKSTFGKLDFAKDFLNNYLPKELISIIDMETLTHEPATYLNKELKEQFADLVYKINLKEKEAYITFLFEHKSYKDRLVIFQVLKYMISIWEAKIKRDQENRKNKRELEIPIIIPVVIYHDKSKWNIKRTLGEMMPGFGEMPGNVKKYIPDFEYLLADIFYSKDEKLKLEKEHAIVLETLSKVRYESKEEIIEIFKRAIEIYTKTKERDIISHYIIETIVYIISTRDDFDETELKDIAEQISKEGGELFMTLAERLIEKGMEEGMQKGEQKRAGEIAKELLLNGMGIDLVAKYTKLSKEEIEEIQAAIGG